MFTKSSQRYIAYFATTAAALGLAVACGSDDKKKSSGGDKGQTPVTTTPTAPTPTTVGTGGFPTNPGYPYPGVPGGNYPPYNPGGNVTVNVQDLEQRLQGRWSDMQQGLVLQFTMPQSRAVYMSTLSQGGFPNIPTPQGRQGTYDVDVSRTDYNRLALNLRFAPSNYDPFGPANYGSETYSCLVTFSQTQGYAPQIPSSGQDQLTCLVQGVNGQRQLTFIRDLYGSNAPNQPFNPGTGF